MKSHTYNSTYLYNIVNQSSLFHPHILPLHDSLTPLHGGVPEAALRDNRLHRVLALTDALRIGQARERHIAERLLETEIASS